MLSVKQGKNVKFGSNIVIQNPDLVEIGDHSYIDDFVKLEGTVKIGRRVHVSEFCMLQGTAGVYIDDYAGLSAGVKVFSATETPNEGAYMSGPRVPEDLRAIYKKPVHIGKNAFVGLNAVILPGAEIGEGAIVGALSMVDVNQVIPPYKVAVGIPAKVVSQRPNFHFENVNVGWTAKITKTITESDINTYALLVGDSNPQHIDEAFAKKTRFQGRIAHGFLTAGLISAAIGASLPGAIYLTQNLNFTNPVRIGDEVTAEVRVTAILHDAPKKYVLKLSTVCINQKKERVVEGEAVILLPRVPEPPPEW